VTWTSGIAFPLAEVVVIDFALPEEFLANHHAREVMINFALA
jgi:hypothetical protein